MEEGDGLMGEVEVEVEVKRRRRDEMKGVGPAKAETKRQSPRMHSSRHS